MDNFLVLLVLSAIATWRITSIINRETIFAPVRAWMGEKKIDKKLNEITWTEYEYPTFLAKLVGCFMCLSVWVGLGCTLVMFVFPYLLLPFVLSAAGIVIDKWLGQIQ